MKRLRLKARALIFPTITLAMSIPPQVSPGQESLQLLRGNIMTPSQGNYGNWTPDSYLRAGWSGYHIVAHRVKGRRTVSYSWKVGDSTYTEWVRDANGKWDLCPDGDCPERTEAFFFQIGQAQFGGRRVPREGYLGKVIKEDNGSVERTELRNEADQNVARFDEVQAQNNNLAFASFRVNEAQVTNLMGFDDNDQVVRFGHIEEADAPWQINQTESYYKNVDGRPQFVTTVVERILTNTNEGKEGIRGSTIWCNSDAFKLTRDSWQRIFKNDRFDFSACLNTPGALLSDARNEIAQALQAGDSRVSSNNTLKTSTGQTHHYYVQSDKCGIGGFSLDCDGTQYAIYRQELATGLFGGESRTNREKLVHINSERMSWSKLSQSYDNVFQKYFDNYPSSKLVTVNWRKERRFSGISRYDNWINNAGNVAVAKLVYEKRDEIYAANLQGQTCSYEDSWDGSGTIHTPNRRTLTGSGRDFVHARAAECGRYVKSTVHFYILFPPTINGESKSVHEAHALLDRILAAMPDQTQPSPELNGAEEFGDFIRILARHNASGSKANATDFDLLVDIATEEDSTAAGNKVEDFFTDLGLAPRRQGRSDVLLPEPQSVTQPTRRTYNDDL